MRALLDTNIIIHRESMQATNYSIGQLFYWLDKLHYEKLVHPYSVAELRKAHNPAQQDIYDARLSAYTQMRTVATQTADFQALLVGTPNTENDTIDNQLLFEIYCGRADVLITEDRKMRQKAERLGIADRVFSINSFIGKVAAENPALIEYKALAIKKEFFGNIDVRNSFFDSFRPDYDGFDRWFAGKCDEEAYVCRTDTGSILGFLYLKTENESEDYSDITPRFATGKRLKVGTFKVEASGFRLGERFIKIIFDNAIERHLNEIYVTMFKDRPELTALYDLLTRWGFYDYGIKNTNGKEEAVLVKRLGCYDLNKSVIGNFPNLKRDSQKLILPIYPQFHTSLFPDSKLNTEIDYISNVPHRYALQKVYITWGYANNINPGDLIAFYRIGEEGSIKKYHSVLTTIGVVDRIITSFKNKEDFLSHCQNRSVFTEKELENFWANHSINLKVLKFVFVKSLNKRLPLYWLWENGIVAPREGPRPFTRITNEQFEKIISDSETSLYV